MSAADEIDAMLDAVAANQVRCPKCGRSDDLWWIEPVWHLVMVGAPITGGLVTGDTDNQQPIFPPASLLPEWPHVMVCGNHQSTADEHGAIGFWHWFTVPRNIVVEYEPNTLADLKGWNA